MLEKDNVKQKKLLDVLLVIIRITNSILNVLLFLLVISLILILLADKFMAENFFLSQFSIDIIELTRSSKLLRPAIWLSNFKLDSLIFISLIIIVIFLLKRALKKYIYNHVEKTSKKILASFFNVFMNLVISIIICIVFINYTVANYISNEYNKLTGLNSQNHEYKIQQIEALTQKRSRQSQREFEKIIKKINQEPKYIASLSDDNYIKLANKISSLVDEKGGVYSEEEHYFRNNFDRAPKTLKKMIKTINSNETKFKWKLLPPEKSIFHMYGQDGEYNMKFVSSDGLFEAVYNKKGDLLTKNNDIDNMGTFNYADPIKLSYKHSVYDVLTYSIFGNTKGHVIKNDMGNEGYENNKLAQEYYHKIENSIKIKN